MVKIAAFSDTHTRHHAVELPPCDIAIFAGDLTSRGSRDDTERFLRWYSLQTQCKNKIFIAGNHDINFDPKFEEEVEGSKWLPALLEAHDELIYLENSGVEILGLNIWGSPITPWFYGDRWAFNKYRGEEINEVWSTIPEDTDILVTHGPPMFKLDVVLGREDFHFLGCAELAKRVKYIKPKLHIFGHIHTGNGIKEEDHTIYVNASILNEQYIPVYKPRIIDL